MDRDLAVHHAKNVHVVSSSTFVTSRQANATFMIIVMALRLADLLRNVMSKWPGLIPSATRTVGVGVDLATRWERSERFRRYWGWS